ncbi:TB2/DP1, HVA22 family-domain-containing protein [Lactifluus volemus]|nr:TB2/DP1, HVA22 family-domain-containing protein [Lactifluus volemus]
MNTLNVINYVISAHLHTCQHQLSLLSLEVLEITHQNMLMFLLSRLLTGWFTFLLPSYSTFKALRQRPLDGHQVERWASYWTVIGAFVAFEYCTEWCLSWLPFYWEMRTVFLLFLSLPQFKGSTYVYKAYLEPFLIQNESDIDASIASARDETVHFIHSRLSSLWDILYSLLSKTPITSKMSPGATPMNGSPILVQKAFQSAQGLWGGISPAAAAASAPNGRPASSRSVSAASTPEKNEPPSFTSSGNVAGSEGYSVDETIHD